MSAITSIIINDGQATPQSHTFSVRNAQSGVDIPAKWMDSATGIPAAMPVLTLLVKETSTGATKVTGVLKTPHINDVSGNNEVTHSELFTFSFVTAPLSTGGQRADILAYAKNLLANAIVVAAVTNGEPAY